jgi:hypothetical protein
MDENNTNEGSTNEGGGSSNAGDGISLIGEDYAKMSDAEVEFHIDEFTKGGPKSPYWNPNHMHHGRVKAVVEALYNRRFRDDADLSNLSDGEAATERYLREQVGVTEGDIEKSKIAIEEDQYQRELKRLGDKLTEKFGAETKEILTAAKEGLGYLTKEQYAKAEEAGLFSDPDFIQGAALIRKTIKRVTTLSKKE